MSWNVETRVSESRVKLIGLETNENSSRIRKKNETISSRCCNKLISFVKLKTPIINNWTWCFLLRIMCMYACNCVIKNR